MNKRATQPTQSNQKLTLTLGCAFALFSASCVNQRLSTRLSEHTETQKTASKNLKATVFSQDEKQLNWDEAHQLLFERNLEYKNSHFQINETKRQRRQQWKRHLPRLFASMRLDTAIQNIANLSKDDFSFNISSNFDFPNPISYHSQAYGLALQEVRATISHELQRRRLTINLYQTFLRSEVTRKSVSKLEKERKQLEAAPTSALVSKISAIREQERALKITLERQRLELNRLFNTPGKNWRLQGSPPHISYRERLQELDFYKNYGSLGLKLQAIEIEGGTLSLWQVKLSRWPTVNLDINAPQYYVSDTQSDLSFQAEDYQLFTGLSKPVELDDIFDRRQLEHAEFRFKQTRAALLTRVENETSQLEVNKRTYRLLLAQKARLQNAVKLAQQQNSFNSTKAISAQITAIKSLHQRIEITDRSLNQLDLHFWLWDDSAWPQH